MFFVPLLYVKTSYPTNRELGLKLKSFSTSIFQSVTLSTTKKLYLWKKHDFIIGCEHFQVVALRIVMYICLIEALGVSSENYSHL